MSRRINNVMSGGYKNAVRLIRTEMNFVNNSATYDALDECGILYYEFIAVLDNRTSKMCQSRDGEVYPMSEKSVGFNFPPLHPRCRSTVAPYVDGQGRLGSRVGKVNGKRLHVSETMNYQEFKEKYLTKANATDNIVPQFKKVEYNEVAKKRTAEEFQRMGEDLKDVAEKYTGRQSRWNGQVVISEKSGKLWNCSIQLESDTPKHIMLHEMIHSCSISYYDAAIYKAHRYAEELPVQFLCQEISAIEGIEIVASGYDEGVELIRDFKNALAIDKTDLDFAIDLIKTPVVDRWDYLSEMITEVIKNGAEIEKVKELNDKLERLIEWKV